MRENPTPYLLQLAPGERERILADLPPLSEPRLLRELLRRLRRSQRELAERIGIPTWKIEQGFRHARPMTADEIAAVRDAIGVREIDLRLARQAAAERSR